MRQKTIDPDVVRQCQQMVVENAPEITAALIKKALEGSQQHAKYLFDFAFEAAPKQADDDDDIPGPSLAEILLERLRQLEETEPEECARA
ncbi:MAG: hypothetical protein ACRD3E_13495 [Terriglobales bacterium]